MAEKNEDLKNVIRKIEERKEEQRINHKHALELNRVRQQEILNMIEKKNDMILNAIIENNGYVNKELQKVKKAIVKEESIEGMLNAEMKKIDVLQKKFISIYLYILKK
jgi:hypothetical protein